MQPIPIIACFGEFLPLLFSWWNSCSIGFKSGDWLGQSSVHKHSFKTLLAHLCAFLQTLILSFFGAGQRFASCCVASVILRQSLPRTVDCQSITPAFWKLLVILQTRLLGFIFTAFMISLSSTTVVFSADRVVVGWWCRWWFPNSWFLHALCFCYSSNWLPLFF